MEKKSKVNIILNRRCWILMFITVPRYIVPTIVIHYFNNQPTKSAVLALVEISNIVFSKSITEDDI